MTGSTNTKKSNFSDLSVNLSQGEDCEQDLSPNLKCSGGHYMSHLPQNNTKKHPSVW